MATLWLTVYMMYMTAKEVASFLGISRQRVHQLSKAGKLTPIETEGPTCYDRGEVEARREDTTPGSFRAPDVPEYVTAAEAAFALGITLANLNWQAGQGKIKSALIGHRRMIPQSEIERCLSERAEALAV